MLTVFTVFLFLVSTSRSSPPDCQPLVQSLEQLEPHHLDGTWALVAGSLSHLPSMKALRLRDSITIHFSNSSETSTYSYTQINRFGDECQPLLYNISVVEVSRFIFDVQNRFNLTGSFLHTSCPDCVVMQWIVRSRRRESLDLYLLSRRRQVEQQEMEEFRAQLECLQLPPPVVMDPAKELCPVPAETRPTLPADAAAQNEDAEKLKA
ncbi:uncharacterized protein LOC141800423 [Halichoeres trimaculatus]|uniref:uncharacterized protein LOC141800423 n=1 Tax=Halichoeres trimaculatus TaxID=147232 RepID=UPI003D9EC223